MARFSSDLLFIAETVNTYYAERSVKCKRKTGQNYATLIVILNKIRTY